MKKTTIINKDLKRRILDISYKYKLSHIGSCLTAIDIIEDIFQTKERDEKFVLSAGHAGLALYVVLEKHSGRNAEKIFNHHGVHPDRCLSCGLDCSSGSLGHGLPIAVGMALADRSKNVYCLISDGECSEGSIWEAMRIKEEQKLDNLKIYLNWNGYGAYKQISFPALFIADTCPINQCEHRVKGNLYFPPNIDNIRINYMGKYPEWLHSQLAHYKIMNENEYKQALEILE
jgi:transketolase N-terminal domain/subunit